MQLLVGGTIVGVEYAGAEAEEALLRRLDRWRAHSEPAAPAAFGVRVALAGLRRRPVAVLHHGTPVLRRFEHLDDAVDHLVNVLEGIETAGSGVTSVEARVFERNGVVALLSTPSTHEVRMEPIEELGIVEIPAWRPEVDIDAAVVNVGQVRHPLAGIAVTGWALASLDAARQHVWARTDGDPAAWAAAIDALGSRLEWRNDDVPQALDTVLSAGAARLADS